MWHAGLAMRTRRIEQGLEQSDLAEQIRRATDDDRWNQQRISRLETGTTKFSIDDLVAVARIQGMPYAWYLDGPESGYRRLREAGLSRSNGNITDISEILRLRSHLATASRPTPGVAFA